MYVIMQREAPEQSGAFLGLATADQCTAAQHSLHQSRMTSLSSHFLGRLALANSPHHAHIVDITGSACP